MLSSIASVVFTLSFVVTVIRMTTPIFFASISSFSAASTGIGNIAIEGIMTMSALFGVLGSYLSQSVVVGIIVGLAMGVGIALMIAFFSMKLGADSTLVGIALNTFANSLAIFILYQLTGDKGSSASLPTPTLGVWNIPVIKDIPVLGTILSGHYILTYVCWVVLIVFFILIYKTPLGMRMRACGLNADAAKTAGINVQKLQVFSLALSGLFAAFGGIYMSLNYLNMYITNMIAGIGWMGIAANGISGGHYGTLLIAALAFGVFRAISTSFSSSSVFPTDLVTAVPYIAVFIGLVAVSVTSTLRAKRGETAE